MFNIRVIWVGVAVKIQVRVSWKGGRTWRLRRTGFYLCFQNYLHVVYTLYLQLTCLAHENCVTPDHLWHGNHFEQNCASSKTTVVLQFPRFTSQWSEILFGVLLPVGYIIFDVFFPAHRVNLNYKQQRSSNNTGCSAVFVHSSVFNVECFPLWAANSNTGLNFSWCLFFLKMIFLDLIKEQYSIRMAQINVQLSFISPIHRRTEMVHIRCEEIKNRGFSCPFSISRRVISLLWPDKCSIWAPFPFLGG